MPADLERIRCPPVALPDLDAFFRQSLAGAGLAATEGDLAVMVMYHEALAPGLLALGAADMSRIDLEYDLDPSRPPRR